MNILKSCCSNFLDTSRLEMINNTIREIKDLKKEKINAIWLETSGCFGEIISLLNADTPNILYLLEDLVNMKYFETIQGDAGETAYETLLNTLNDDYIFIVSGAIPTRDNGLYTTVATYKGRRITAMEAVMEISKKARHIIAVGTCACYGGPTAAKPNPSLAVSVDVLLKRNDIIKLPGCPVNPICTIGTIAYLVSRGVPDLDSEGRPTAYYGETIHDNCPRRRFFDAGIFAKSFGDEECMFMLGCKGPITYAYCPISRWNSSDNWPIADNTTCIGCASQGFPDKTEPFVSYGGNL